jgi:lipid A 3-O-deacylase
MRWLASIALALGAASAFPARAASLLVDAERGSGVQSYGIGTVVFRKLDIRPEWGWQLDRSWVARAAYWSAEHPYPFGKHLADFSFMPTLRLAQRPYQGLQPFVEAGIGAHLLSSTHIDNRRLSTAFQFGEQLAVGFRVQARIPFAVSLRAEHVSNGGIKEPNPGVTFACLRLELGWR